MRDYFILFLILGMLLSSCLGRPPKSSGSSFLSVPAEFAPQNPGEDLNNNGLRDDIEKYIRDQEGLGPNEPIPDAIMQAYLDSLKEENEDDGLNFTAADISKLTEIGSGLLSTWIASGYNYAAENAKTEAEKQKWEAFADQVAKGAPSFSVAPYGVGNLVEKDKDKIDGKFSVNSDSYIKFKKGNKVDGNGKGTFEWQSGMQNGKVSGVYLVMMRPGEQGGYMDFAYSTDTSIFNGLYTVNVTRCCYYKLPEELMNVDPFAKWDIPVDGSKSGIDNYIITQVNLTFQTKGDKNVTNETYILDDSDGKCKKVECHQ